MERHNCKSKFSKASPFRATQLWNEAVSILQNGMPTRRHFYRMRYYDNCFSGKEAVDWLTRSLTNNPRFGENVTIEGTRKLLQHFLSTGIFQSVKGTLTFKESGLFEFIDRTMQSPSRKQDHKHVFHHVGLKEVSQNVPLAPRRPSKEETQRNQPPFPLQESIWFSPVSSRQLMKSKSNIPYSSSEFSWTDFILKRLKFQLPSLSVDLLVDLSLIEPGWIQQNVCPEYANLRKKTELPFWVFTAINSVIHPQDKESEYTTYEGFEKDVYTVVKDYLKHRSSPLIPFCMYELIMYTFNHLHYMDLEVKNRTHERNSVENLVLSMSHGWNDECLLNIDDLTKTVLPPNSCFETAFTSDEPVTRIVPQSSVDTICLASSQPVRSPAGRTQNAASRLQTNIIASFEELNKFDALPKRIPSPLREKSVLTKFRNRKASRRLRRTQSMAQIDSTVKGNTLPTSIPTNRCSRYNCPSQHRSYINYGLSQSMDDLLAVDDNEGLDFEAAMQSVNSLMRVSRRHQKARSSTSDLNSSSLESLSTVASYRGNKTTLVCIDSCLWYEDIQDTARDAFQSILMLMSPASRTSLRMLLQFIDLLPVPAHSSITKTEMVYDLSAHILSPGPRSKNVYSHHMVLSVVYFLVDNCQHLFNDLPPDQLPPAEDKSDDNHKENKPTRDPMVFCKQLTKNEFEDQGVTSSWLALAELLEQIVNDKKMKSKEKKRRLKKFKEAYPHIYKQRFGSSSNLASLVHFR